VARRGHIGVGLVVLALWFQALAPVLALRAMAFADPLAHAVICGHALDAADPAPAEEGEHAACTLCGLCTAGLSGAILPDMPACGSLPAGLWQAVAWPIPPPSPPLHSGRHPGQPRAPPALA